MIDFGAEFGTVALQGAALVEPVAEGAYLEQNQSVIDGLFRGGSILIRWLIGIGFTVATVFCIWGFIKLNRAADNPQMRSGAIAQIVVSILSAGGIAMVFFFIGGGVEFFSTAFGGQNVDVGNVGIVDATATEIRLQNEFLGMYNNNVLLCSEAADGTPASLGWTWRPGDATADDVDGNADTGQCSKPPGP